MRTCRSLATLALATMLGVGGALAVTACSSNVPARVQFDDATITTEVKAKLAADPEVAAHNIDVDTNEGVVTLSGRVDTAAERSEAEQLALRTDGVRRVINNLRVGDRTS